MKRLAFWYEFASTYSYLAAMRIARVAGPVELEVDFHPFLLGPIFAAQGWKDSPFNLYQAKGRYMWRDMERLCEGYGLPFRRPSVFPRNGLLAARVATVAGEHAWGADFARAVFHASFAEDREISEPSVVGELLLDLGRDPDATLEAAVAPANKEQLRAQTARASELGIFGAPSFVVDRELFWGNDRLGDAIAWAALGPP